MESNKQRILNSLGNKPDGYRLKDIATMVNLVDPYVHVLLAELIKEKSVKRIKRGVYKAV